MCVCVCVSSFFYIMICGKKYTALYTSFSSSSIISSLLQIFNVFKQINKDRSPLLLWSGADFGQVLKAEPDHLPPLGYRKFLPLEPLPDETGITFNI